MRFHKIGALSEARVEAVPRPTPGPGEVYLTAWSALVAAGQLRGGETTLILGVTGAVGSGSSHRPPSRSGC